LIEEIQSQQFSPTLAHTAEDAVATEMQGMDDHQISPTTGSDVEMNADSNSIFDDFTTL
jgi:hypothetical protein